MDVKPKKRAYKPKKSKLCIQQSMTPWKQTLIHPIVRDEVPGDTKDTYNMPDNQNGVDDLMKLTNGSTIENEITVSDQEQLIPSKRVIKRPKLVENNVPADKLPLMIHVNGHKFVKLMQQQNTPIINLREFITATDGKLYPTKKGILLSLEDWQKLMKVDISPLIELKKE